MTPLRTTVVVKTDISGSTSRFRELLAADLQALLGEHRDFLARHAASYDGRIIKAVGDGYWLEFPSVTAAAKAAIEMQEALRLTQLNRGDDRIAIRIVIALGDIAVQDGDFIGDVFALATRVEAVTPPDEIYLTAAARLALTSSEIQTALVESFAFKGFAEPMPVIVSSGAIARAQLPIPSFCSRTSAASVDDGCWARQCHGRAHPRCARCANPWQRAGIWRYRALQSRRFLLRDVRRGRAGHWVGRAFDPELGSNPASGAIRLHDHIGLHRGTLYTFRSFLYGRDVWIASQLQSVSAQLLGREESGIFVTGAVCDCAVRHSDGITSSWPSHCCHCQRLLPESRSIACTVRRPTETRRWNGPFTDRAGRISRCRPMLVPAAGRFSSALLC